MQPGQRKRRFYVITAGVFIAIVAAAIAIVAITEYSYVNVEVHENTHVSFVLAYDSTNVTISSGENATVAVLPSANVTLTAVVDPSYAISGWVVTGATYHQETGDAISFLSGSGGGTISVSVDVVNGSTGPG